VPRNCVDYSTQKIGEAKRQNQQSYLTQNIFASHQNEKGKQIFHNNQQSNIERYLIVCFISQRYAVDQVVDQVGSVF
jgi:hypothetical protein